MKSKVRLIILVVLTTQLSYMNFAQTKPDSKTQLPRSRPTERMPTQCELLPNHFRLLSIEYLEKNLALCRAAGNQLALPVTIRSMGTSYLSQGRIKEALEAFQEALSLSESLGDKAGVIWAMLAIGGIHTNQNNNEQALELLQKALALSEELADKRLIASSLRSLGRFHESNGKNYALAQTFYEKELKLWEEIGDKLQLAVVLESIGYNYMGEENRSKALEYFFKSFVLYEEIDPDINKSGTNRVLTQIGLIYSEQGYYSQALEIYDRSLKIKEGLKNPNFEPEFLMIAAAYRSQGNFPKALEYYQKILQLYDLEEILTSQAKEPTAQKDNPVVITRPNAAPFDINMFKISQATTVLTTLARIGAMYLYNNDYDSAKKYFEDVLRIIQTLEEKNEVLIAARKSGDLNERSTIIQFCEQSKPPFACVLTLGNFQWFYVITQQSLGLLNMRNGKYSPAMEHYRKMLPFCEKNKIVQVSCVGALSKIGYLYGLEGNFAKGLEFADRASAQAKLLSIFTSFDGHLLSGDAYRSLGQLDKARRDFEEAISRYESTSAKITDETHRLTFIEKTDKSVFELYIDVLMQLHRQRPSEGFDALALQASERFRARLLVELLNESRANIRQGVEPTLISKERELQKQLNERAEQQTRLLTGNYNAQQVAALQKQIDALIFEFQQTKAQIRINSPRYAALTQPQPLTASEIQRDLLDADTVLLEYALGVERSYLWVVTSTSLKSYELPKRAEIENDVRRVAGLLNDGKRWASDEKINAEFTEAAVPLSRKLLPPDVLSQLKGKRLAIVADGALQYLPFGALPLTPESNSNDKKQKSAAVPLAVEFETVSLPSASVLAVQRRETGNRKAPAKNIAIFADPVFSETDERLASVKAEQSKIKQPATPDLNRLLLERAFNLSGETMEPLSIPRLPFTQREADGIFAAAPSTNSFKALNFEASRDNVLKPEISDYRIVHFATHGLLNSENPELSGIVLSLVNKQGQPIDGFLRLNEIYNLNLSADLVVLSACQTALGKEIKGEGLIGLTRGFMYAGSPRVVASLWKVDDVATAELMKLFYQKMLQEKMTPAAALRAAKIEMWKQKRWNAPFYWAAFELQGEWR